MHCLNKDTKAKRQKNILYLIVANFLKIIQHQLIITITPISISVIVLIAFAVVIILNI